MKRRKVMFWTKKTEYLSFWVTRTDIQPINKKEEAIVKIKSPKKTKEVCALISIVNYCRDMWDKRPHLLHPLTAIKSHKVKLKWTDLEKKSIKWYQTGYPLGHLTSVSGIQRTLWYQYGCQRLPGRLSYYLEQQTNCFLHPQTDKTKNTVYSNGKGIY